MSSVAQRLFWEGREGAREGPVLLEAPLCRLSTSLGGVVGCQSCKLREGPEGDQVPRILLPQLSARLQEGAVAVRKERPN